MADSDDEDILYDNDLGRNLIGGKRVKNVNDVLNGGKKDKRKLRKTLALCMAFLSLGLCLAILGPTLLSLKDHLDTTLPKISWVFAGRSVGYLTGAILGGMLFESFNPIFLLAVSLLLCGIGITIAPFVTTVLVLAMSISTVGVSMGFLDTGANLVCLRMWGKKRSGTMLQALHFSFALGAFISPLVAAPFLATTPANNTMLTVSTTPTMPLKTTSAMLLTTSTLPMTSITDAVHVETSSHSNRRKRQGDKTPPSGPVTPKTSTDNKTAPKTSTDDKTVPEKSTDNKTAPKTSTDDKTAPKTSPDDKTTPKTSTDDKTVPEKLTDDKTVPEKLTDDKTVPKTSTDDKTAPKTSPDDKTTPKTSTDDKTVPEKSTDNKTAPKTSTDDKTAPKTSPDDKTTPKTSTDDKTVPEKLTDDKTVPKTSTDDITAPKTSPDDKTAPKTSTDDKDTPEKSTDDQNAPETSPHDQTAPKTSPHDQTTPEKSTDDKTAPKTSTDDKTAPKTSPDDKTAPKTSTDDKTVPEKSTDDKTAPKTSTDDKTAPKTSPDDKTAPKTSTNDKTVPEKSTDDKTAPKTSTDDKTAPKTSPDDQTTPEYSTDDKTTPEISLQSAPQRQVERFAMAYIIIGVLVLLTSVVFFYFLCTQRKDEPTYTGSEHHDEKSDKNNFPFRSRIIILLFFFYFLYVGGEVAYGSFVSMFASKSKYQFEQDRASHVAALFWGAFALGRGLAICLASVISPLKMVIGDMVGCVSTSLVLTLFADSNENVLWIGSAILGLSMASLFPSGIAWLESYTPVTGNTASFLIVGSALGEMCVPLVIGYLFEDIIGPMVLMYWMLATSAVSALIFLYVIWLVAENGQEKKSLPAEKSPALELFQSVEEALPMEELFKNGRSNTQMSKQRIPPILKRKNHRE